MYSERANQSVRESSGGIIFCGRAGGEDARMMMMLIFVSGAGHGVYLFRTRKKIDFSFIYAIFKTGLNRVQFKFLVRRVENTCS
jgi:hypothetical protein